MSMTVLGPNLENFGPEMEENKPFEFLKKNVSFVFHRPLTTNKRNNLKICSKTSRAVAWAKYFTKCSR